MSEVWWLRLGILVAGLVLILAIYFFGRPSKPGQGTRRPRRAEPGRHEPTFSEQVEASEAGAGQAAPISQADMFGEEEAAPASAVSRGSEAGKRVSEEFDKIVTLYLAARAGRKLHGPDIVVAAEKAGLSYGYMGVFHRLVEHHPERGPVFSVANIMKPGSFDMADIQSLETPAIAFFLTLPAPVPALDAWEAMLPTAERMAELLDGVVLDEQRNTLGRQRIAHIRDELRAYDRQREAPPLNKPGRW
ncbi:cell division protein ZipA [Lysobacter sp. SG-8]|uniref:Cell division protein ZipA n=1 Tax=Marilutibacter penaei TaxID=2759900 RepID=A0A7W3U250_9GAMM|nr:cell division protein ZipA [Lysobacter penaei]MBB1087563.1 cell division protein ZipA [Lysobacter penaei]